LYSRKLKADQSFFIENALHFYNTTTDHIEKLCLYFGCSPNDLMTIIPEEKEERKKRGRKN
jgi:hypothetical protein